MKKYHDPWTLSKKAKKLFQEIIDGMIPPKHKLKKKYEWDIMKK